MDLAEEVVIANGIVFAYAAGEDASQVIARQGFRRVERSGLRRRSELGPRSAHRQFASCGDVCARWPYRQGTLVEWRPDHILEPLQRAYRRQRPRLHRDLRRHALLLRHPSLGRTPHACFPVASRRTHLRPCGQRRPRPGRAWRDAMVRAVRPTPSGRRGCASTTRSRSSRWRARASRGNGRPRSTPPPAYPADSRQGVTASGVTLFVPMSVVTGAGDRVYGLDNDIAFVVWQRRSTSWTPRRCPRAPAPRRPPRRASCRSTRQQRGTRWRGQPGRLASATAASLVVPGEGAPVDTVRRQAQAAARANTPGSGASSGQRSSRRNAIGACGRRARRASTPAPASASTTLRAGDVIPGAPPPDTNPRNTLARPSGVVYVIARDGRLRVLGLASGKDLQQPASFLPRGARWTAPVAVGTTLYAATTGGCGSTPDGVWAIDLASESKPVVSWATNGGPVVGPVAVTSSGVLLAAVGAGTVTGRRKGQRHCRARPEDACGHGLVHASGRGVRDRADPCSDRATARSSRQRRRTAEWCCSTRRRSVAPITRRRCCLEPAGSVTARGEC